jgi:hypothetical protein
VTDYQALILVCAGAVVSVICILLAGCLALTNERETKKRQNVRRGLHDILKTLEEK